jgi:serine/threonine protein phosphatase PrpC
VAHHGAHHGRRRRGLLPSALTERDPVHFTCAARTDIGIVRSGNEDNYLMLAERGVFIVADGMGGHAAGEVASEMAVRITSGQIGSLRGLSDEDAGERVSAAIRSANDAIFERTLAEHDKRGMGTTATVLVLMPRRYLIGQVGDSRAYLLRRGEFQQLTKDHSYVQEQVDAGLLTPEQARVHPYSNVITRCVGASMDVVPDIYFGALEEGDVLLLASDGLTGMLEDEQLTRILTADGGPQHWVDRMVTEANRRGGLDNITAIVVRIDSVESTTGEHPATATAAGGSK